MKLAKNIIFVLVKAMKLNGDVKNSTAYYHDGFGSNLFRGTIKECGSEIKDYKKGDVVLFRNNTGYEGRRLLETNEIENCKDYLGKIEFFLREEDIFAIESEEG